MRDFSNLKNLAWLCRMDALTAIYNAQSGHPGGSFSAAELIVGLYFHAMNIDPSNPQWPDRDRMILSKGHASPLLYAVLARRGFFPLEDVYSMRTFGSPLTSTPSLKVPGCDMSSGSLGQGLSIGLGMALAGKADGKSYRVYVLLGDGENQEGQVWEAAMASAHHRAENLVAIIDRNHVQMCGTTDDILDPGDIASKYSAFGWNTLVIDGHDMAAVIAALDRRFENGKPTAIVAETVKGKGVSYMEGRFEWHGAAPDKEHYELAMQELRGHLR